MLKKAWFFLVFWAVLAFSCAVWAQDAPVVPPPDPQTAESHSNEAVFRPHGDNSVGGWSGANSDANALAKDFCEPTANTTADGFAVGTQTIGPGQSAISQSQGTASSSFNAVGTETQGNANGFSEQAVWVNVAGDENNFANSLGATNGEYHGSLASNTTGVNGQGVTQSTGVANNFIAATDTTREANAMTVDRSSATIDVLGGTTKVSGVGYVSAQSYMETSGALAIAGGTGSATYNGVGGSNIAGSLDVTTADKVEILPDSARASSATNSHAVITPCGASCPPQ